MSTAISTGAESVDSIPPSLFYSILPKPLQDRVPRFSSIRRSVISFSALQIGRSWSASTASSRSGSQTPPPTYTASLGKSEAPVGSDEETAWIHDIDDSADDESGSSLGRSSSGFTTPMAPVSEKESSIAWEYARQGLNILTLAFRESASSDQETSARSAFPPLSRNLYVHSLTYLLRALPADLSPAEVLNIRSSLPPSTSTNTTPVLEAPETANEQTSYFPARQATPPSLLHRLCAAYTFYLFLFASVVLPYVSLFLRSAHAYERKHRVTERFLSGALDTADSFGRSSVAFFDAVCRMNEGKVGEAIGEARQWCVQGVLDGLHDGVGQGLEVFGIGAKGAQGGKHCVRARQSVGRQRDS